MRHVVAIHDNEDTLFQKVGVDADVFLDCLALVRDVVWETRGRRSVIRSNHERIFFLMAFLSRGVGVLGILAVPYIKTKDHVVVLLKKIAALFLPRLAAGAIRFYNERIPEAPGCSLVIDCTVCQFKKPGLHFRDALAYEPSSPRE